MTKKWTFFPEKIGIQKSWSAKNVSVPPPNSAPGLRRCRPNC